MKKKVILSFLCLMLILLCVIAPFWGFSILALPLMFFADVCNLLLPIIALSVLVLSLRAFWVKEFARFNKIVGGLTLIMIVTLMNLFIDVVKLPFVAFLFLVPLIFGYWIFKKNDVRYYLLIFPVVFVVILPIMYLWYKAVV